MESVKVTLIAIILALVVAGSLATMSDKKILGAQYKRYTSLVDRAEQLFAAHQYGEAARLYREALTIDAKNTAVWNKYEQSQQALITSRLEQKRPRPAAGMMQSRPAVTMPSMGLEGGMIIEEDEGC